MGTPPLQMISKVLGWIYTFCWSASFYPQPILNWRRQSTSGATIDFPTVNILGFVALAIYTGEMSYSPQTRYEYALRNHGLTPTVQTNDFVFALHATILSVLTLYQFIPAISGYDKGAKTVAGTKLSWPAISLMVASLVWLVVNAVIVFIRRDDDPKTGWAWIDLVYAFSEVKMLITLFKYTPQVYLNYRNHSTHGWSILQILLDFAGGLLSIVQQGIDSYLQNDWSGITGNPIKFLLGSTSIFFDIIFMIQHYWLYRGSHVKSSESEEEDRLIEPGEEGGSY